MLAGPPARLRQTLFVAAHSRPSFFALTIRPPPKDILMETYANKALPSPLRHLSPISPIFPKRRQTSKTHRLGQGDGGEEGGCRNSLHGEGCKIRKERTGSLMSTRTAREKRGGRPEGVEDGQHLSNVAKTTCANNPCRPAGSVSLFQSHHGLPRRARSSPRSRPPRLLLLPQF